MRISALDDKLDTVTSMMREKHIETHRAMYALMETAMMIQETFDDMSYAQQVNPDKVGHYDPYELRSMFIEWADEFESRFHDDDRYENDYMEFVKEFAEKKITELFGKENLLKTYEVTWTQTLMETYTVNAESEEEAIDYVANHFDPNDVTDNIIKAKEIN